MSSFGEQRFNILYFVSTPVQSVNYSDGLGRCFRCLYLCLYCCVFVLLPYFRWIKIYTISIIPTFVFVSHKQFWRGCFVQPYLLSPGHLPPPLTPWRHCFTVGVFTIAVKFELTFVPTDSAHSYSSSPVPFLSAYPFSFLVILLNFKLLLLCFGSVQSITLACINVWALGNSTSSYRIVSYRIIIHISTYRRWGDMQQGNRTRQTPPRVWCCPLVGQFEYTQL